MFFTRASRPPGAGSIISFVSPSCPLWLNPLVPKKKKPKRFRATTAVKAMARQAIGTPPPVQREESTRRPKKEKHKPTLRSLLSDAESP